MDDARHQLVTSTAEELAKPEDWSTTWCRARAIACALSHASAIDHYILPGAMAGHNGQWSFLDHLPNPHWDSMRHSSPSLRQNHDF